MRLRGIQEVELVRLGGRVDAGESGACEEDDSQVFGKPLPSPAGTP